MKNYKYIFWDLDGTLMNTFEGVANCVNYAFEPYGIHIEDNEYMRNFIGPPLRMSFPTYGGLPEEFVEEAIARYRERYNPIGVFESTPYPGIADALLAIREAGKIQVVASSKPEIMCKKVLERNHLADLFDEIVGASFDGKIDTKIEVLSEAFRRMKDRDASFSKEDVVLIGDTKYDADGAHAAGIDCIGITWGFGTREELVEHGIPRIYDDVETLKADLCGFSDGNMD